MSSSVTPHVEAHHSLHGVGERCRRHSLEATAVLINGAESPGRICELVLEWTDDVSRGEAFVLPEACGFYHVT